jgi:hypothetical protein
MAQAYKWVDRNGVVSYSQTPPESVKVETQIIKQQSQSNGTDTNNELLRLRQKLEDHKEDRQLAEEAARKATQESETKSKNCDAARSNLEKLQTSGNRMLKTTDGNYIRLSESEREQRIQAAHDQIKANCSR